MHAPCPPIFFSVPRLCGSRQVVAHCCADRTNYAYTCTVSLFGGSKVEHRPSYIDTPPAPPCGNVGQVPCFCDTEAFLAYSKPDHVSNVSHLFVLAICIAACDCCFGWIRFCHWAGRGEGSDDCNVLNHVQSSAGLQQACLRFETRFFV